MSDRRPDWKARLLRCLGCEHRWQGWIPMYVQVAVFVAVLNALTCPKCHACAKHIVFDLEAERREGEAPP